MRVSKQHLKINATGKYPLDVLEWIERNFTKSTREITIIVDDLRISFKITNVTTENQEAMLGAVAKFLRSIP